MEERISALEDRMNSLEQARYSVGTEDEVPGMPVYSTWADARAEYHMQRTALYNDRYRDVLRIWDHDVAPARDVTHRLPT